MTQQTFTAVWPVLDPTDPEARVAEAVQDLPNIAHRHGARITGPGRFQFRLGKNVAGSQGAKYVVVCDVPAVKAPVREYQPDAEVKSA